MLKPAAIIATENLGNAFEGEKNNNKNKKTPDQ